jgi:AcrR family transcriptional regulator
VAAARELFWECGYQGSTLAELETATGLSRSSLYQAFGTKEALFARALDSYIEGFMTVRLGGMERPGSGPRDVAGFFHGLAELFRDDAALGHRGCLWVNSVAELTGREPALDARADEYGHRLRGAFAKALSEAAGGSPTPRLIDRRSRMLAATTIGIWLMVRFDPSEAARVCDGVVAEVRSWSGLRS